MKFIKAIPILYTTDIMNSVSYFTERLKFENKWTYDTPPTFAGVYRDDVEIFFCKADQGNPCTWLSILVDDVDEYYELIRNSGAEILSTPDSKEWSIREMIIKCPDGHVLRVGHNTDCD